MAWLWRFCPVSEHIGPTLTPRFAWRFGTTATGPCIEMRHIPRDEVRADAALLPFPLEAYDAGDAVCGCPPLFGYRGLLWAQGSSCEDDIEVHLPWRPGEGFAGHGPWQVVAWDAADASIPAGALTEALMAKHLLESDGNDEEALRALADHAEASREGLAAPPPTRKGWRVLFSIAGSEVAPGFEECLHVWYRRDGGGFEYDVSLAPWRFGVQTARVQHPQNGFGATVPNSGRAPHKSANDTKSPNQVFSWLKECTSMTAWLFALSGLSGHEGFLICTYFGANRWARSLSPLQHIRISLKLISPPWSCPSAAHTTARWQIPARSARP